MDFTGYIDYNHKIYTFTYKDKLLTMILSDPNFDDSWFFNSPENVDYFKGYTSQGKEIYFYIDNDITKFGGIIKCFPKIVIYSTNSNYSLSKTKYCSMKFSGGVINNFYSNRHIFDGSIDNKVIKFKELEQAKKEENIIIDNKKAIFQISVSYPSIHYGTGITIGNINSTIRLIYNKPWKSVDLIKSILKIDDLLFFCMNRRCFDFDKIYLELRNEEGKFFNAAEIYVPYEKNEDIPKNMIDYLSIEGKLNKLLKILDNVNYLTYSIPADRKEFISITATNYSNIFSAFQSLYNYCYSKKDIVYDENEFDELKDEIINSLKLLSDKYKGVNAKKRKYVDKYINIVKQSNLTLEHMIIQEIEKYNHVLRDLPDKKYISIMNNYSEIVKDAVHDRDMITHSDVFAPSDSDIAVYLTIKRLIYAMVLKKIGLSKSEVKNKISYLNSMKVI